MATINSDKNTLELKTACNRDCPDACGLIATVEDDRVVRLQGDPDHPITKGFLCHRTSRFLQRQYDPDRLLTPLIRRDGDLRPATWPEALDLIAEKMLAIREESGGAAIMHYRCGGSMGMMKLVTDYFFERFGPVTIKSGDICTGAGDEAQSLDFGFEDSNDLFDLRQSRTIVLWGKNVSVSNIHLVPLLKECRKNGAKVVLIDPIHHATTSLCDSYVQLRPGGDLALVMGISRWLFENGGQDPTAAEYCDHLDTFRQLALSRSTDEWAELADIPKHQVQELGAAYAAGPTATLMGWGMQRRANGCATIRAIDALAAISGNLGVSGGGASFYYNRRGAFDTSFVEGEAVAPRTIPEPMLGPGILAASEPPIRMVWVTCGNPVAMLPQSSSVAEALRTRELTVVVDSFLTDSARNAHVVLPTTTMLEDDDLLGSYGHHWLAEMRPVIPPPEDVKTDYEIVQALAKRVGLVEAFSGDVDSWKERMLRPSIEKGLSLEQLREGSVKSPLADEVVFTDRVFGTPSGKVNLVTEIDPEPPRPSANRPMLLMAISTRKAQGSQWVDGGQDRPLEATVHPSQANGFADGQSAHVETEFGRLQVVVRHDDRQRKDVLLLPKGGWLTLGRCANDLVPAQVSDGGGCAVYYDTPARLV